MLYYFNSYSPFQPETSSQAATTKNTEERNDFERNILGVGGDSEQQFAPTMPPKDAKDKVTKDAAKDAKEDKRPLLDKYAHSATSRLRTSTLRRNKPEAAAPGAAEVKETPRTAPRCVK